MAPAPLPKRGDVVEYALIALATVLTLSQAIAYAAMVSGLIG